MICTLEKSICLRAFAKINLGLKILAKRPDGYHEIRTIYQTISLHDRLEISLRKAGEGIHFECDNPEIPSGARKPRLSCLRSLAARARLSRRNSRAAGEDDSRRKRPRRSQQRRGGDAGRTGAADR